MAPLPDPRRWLSRIRDGIPPLSGRTARLGPRTAAGLLLLLAGCGGDLTGSSASSHLTDMLLSERFTAGRLAGQVVWEPCTVVGSDSLIPRTSCGRSPRAEDTLRSKRIDDAVRAAGGSRSSVTTRRAWALLDLRSGNEIASHFDRAVDSLEQALRLAPDDPVALNDLAVAYLELGERDQQLVPMLRALDAIERAVAQDSTQTSILFNRALILQRLYLVKGAERAWDRYLAVERHPRWRAEAEAYARAVAQTPDTVSWDALLESPPERMDASTRAAIAARVRESPQAARESGFPLLAQWGAAVERGDHTRAARLLTLAREIGASARAPGLDRSVSLAVGAIDAAAGDSLRLRKLARGHVDLGEGFRLFTQGLEEEAVPLVDRADRVLRAAGSPAAHWAVFYSAAAAVNGTEYESADPRLRRLVDEAGPGEPALVGKSIWALGLSQLRRGNYDSANQRYREAAPYIVRARETENQGAVAVLLGEGLTLSGRAKDGRAEAYRALRILAPFRRSIFLNNQLALVASSARSDGLSYAARAVADEVVMVAGGIERPTTRALAYAARVRDLMALGRHGAARADLKEATRWAGRIKPGKRGDRVRARVNLILGQLTRSRDPRAALPILSRAVDTYTGFKNDFYLPTALYEAALAARAVGDRARARRWLQQAVEHVERQEASFVSTETRATFYETVENVFDEMIDVELKEEGPEAAFRMLERGRIHARSEDGRRASSAGTGAASAGPAEIGASLPEDMLLIEYALLRERLVIWTASRGGTGHYMVPVPRDSVAALVDELRRGASLVSTGTTDARARLFELLIRPLAAELRGIRQLTVVPDRELSRVPFAALMDSATGRYLVEGYRLRTVPSAAFYMAAAAKVRDARAGASALVIGNPTLDTASVGPLPPLPGAAREAGIVAGLYPGSVLLRSADARRGRVLDLLPAHPVVHFAGHAVFDAEHPELSYLALAPDRSGKGGILYAREIGKLSLSNVEVVVLSACSSLSPRASRTGAVAGLAYSFLRAGAPATVSTLWDVDDGATTELVVNFHGLLASGTPAAEALRLAQVDALKSTRPELSAPEAWAAFIYTGP